MTEDVYYEQKPDSELAPFIQCFWSKRTYGFNCVKYRIVPDGCADIIFNLSTNDIPLYVVGMADRYVDKIIDSPSFYIGIRFKPGGLFPFIKDDVSHLTNVKTDLHSASKELHKALEHCFVHAETDIERFGRISKVLRTHLHKQKGLSDVYTRVSAIAAEIFLGRSILSTPNLSAEACLCERQFQRQFKQMVGLTPKALVTIVRFNRTLKLLKEATIWNVSQISVMQGYYDHAHLYKDFQRFQGSKPRLK